MSDVFHWSCPFCNHDATLRVSDYKIEGTAFTIQEPAEGHKYFSWKYIVCPNPDCKKYTLQVLLYECFWNPHDRQWTRGDFIHSWRLIPSSQAKVFPDYIPTQILDDYNEACLISDMSPKASATLARRCLQGILRDFWKVKPDTLFNEIEEIKHKTDPQTWDAIHSIRKIGNIGAHMEKDIDLIIDVDPDEALMLIKLIEILIKDWYILREERKKHLTDIKLIAEKKYAERKGISKE